MKKILAAVAVLIVISMAASAATQTGIVVLANDIDYNLGFDFFAYFVNNGHNVTRATVANFDALKTEPLVVVLGGPDAPEGVGHIVDNLLEESDREFLRNAPGSNAMYVKTNVWKTPQTVVVLAGNNRQDTNEIAMEKRTEVINKTAAVQEEIAEIATETEIILTIEDETHGWATNNGYVQNIIYTMNNKGTNTIDAAIDLYIYELPSSELVYSSADVEPHWNETFNPNMNRYANITEKVTLAAKGNYRLELRVRDGTSSEVLASDTKEFSIG